MISNDSGISTDTLDVRIAFRTNRTRTKPGENTQRIGLHLLWHGTFFQRHAQCLSRIINAKRSKPEVVTALSGLAAEILLYLQAHPNASDTLLGITEWWLLKQRIEIAANEVQKALDQLVLREFLLKTGSHSSTSFRLNRRKLVRIRSLLAKRHEESTQ